MTDSASDKNGAFALESDILRLRDSVSADTLRLRAQTLASTHEREKTMKRTSYMTRLYSARKTLAKHELSRDDIDRETKLRERFNARLEAMQRKHRMLVILASER